TGNSLPFPQLVQELEQIKERSHQKAERQTISTAQREEVEHVGIQVQQQEASCRDDWTDVTLEDQKGKAHEHRIADQVRKTQHDFATPCEEVPGLCEERVQEVIRRHLKVENGKGIRIEDGWNAGVDIPDEGSGLVISQWHARCPQRREREEERTE